MDLPSKSAEAEFDFDFVLNNYAQILTLRRINHTANYINRY